MSYDTASSLCSLLSASGMSMENISRLVGHSGTDVTERVYRHQLLPVLEAGAEEMDRIFASEDDNDAGEAA